MMICRRLVVSGESMGGLVVRRRQRELTIDGHKIPESVLTFTIAQWAGSSDYQRWVAWDEARTLWAEAHLPNGTEDLPSDLGKNLPPDQPWDEVEI